MKNLIYGLGLSVITLILLLIITTTSSRMMRETEIRETLANAVDNAVENVMETNTYDVDDRKEFVSDVMENLALQYHSTSEKVRISVNSADCEEGVLFIKATAFYKNPIGNTGSVEYTKKSIYADKGLKGMKSDREYEIYYMLDEDTVYRSYPAKLKDAYPVPENPVQSGKVFINWRDAEGNTYVKGQNFPATVTESATYYAVFSTESMPAQSLTLEAQTDTMTVGARQALKAIVLPENATNKAVKWSSSDTSILTVNSIGFVTAMKEGEADITVELADGSLPPASCHIKVKDVSEIKVTADTTFVNEDETRKITVTTVDGEQINADCSFTSSNPSVVYVNSIGIMQPMGPGTAYITITHRRSGASTSIPVMIAEVTDYHGVYDQNEHGIKVTCPGADIVYYTDANGSNESETSPMYTDAGEYEVSYKISFSNCEPIEGSAFVMIEKAERQLSISASEDTLVYPEQKTYSFTSDEDDMTKVSMQTENNNGCLTATKEGNSIVVKSGVKEGDVDVNICVPETTNYKMTMKTLKIHVKNGTIRADVAIPQNGSYDGESHTIKVTPLAPCDDAVVTYSSTEDGDYTTVPPECVDAGTYTVYYRVEMPGYKTISSSANVVIKKAPGKLSFNKKEIALTGESSCELSVTENLSEGNITFEIGNDSLIAMDKVYTTVVTEEILDEETGEVLVPESTSEVFNGYKITAKEDAYGYTYIKAFSEAGANYEKSECIIPVYIGAECGVYDTNGILVLPWNDLMALGVDITKDYTADTYKTDENSMYSTLKAIKDGTVVPINEFDMTTVTVGKIIIPATHARIGNYAFAGLDTVTQVTVLSGVTSIGENAFAECPALTNVVLPSSVTTIGGNAFSGVQTICAEETIPGAPWGATELHHYPDESDICSICGHHRAEATTMASATSRMSMITNLFATFGTEARTQNVCLRSLFF